MSRHTRSTTRVGEGAQLASLGAALLALAVVLSSLRDNRVATGIAGLAVAAVTGIWGYLSWRGDRQAATAHRPGAGHAATRRMARSPRAAAQAPGGPIADRRLTGPPGRARDRQRPVGPPAAAPVHARA